MRNLGNNFKRIASETSVKEPEMSACDAMIAARVAKITAIMLNPWGTLAKNGFKVIASA